jgi:hypothetical protein
MGIYSEAIKRPFSDMYKFILGSLLNILPIINFFALGYIYEAAQLALKRKKDLPEWKGFGNLFVKGFFVFIINLIWVIPFTILFMLAFSSVMIGREVTAGELTYYAQFSILSLISIIVFILTVYLIPLAIMGYMSTGKIGNAFHLGTIIKKAFTLRYFIAWLVSTIVLLVYILIVSFVPLANFILVPAAIFAGLMTMYTIIAGIYTKL